MTFQRSARVAGFPSTLQPHLGKQPPARRTQAFHHFGPPLPLTPSKNCASVTNICASPKMAQQPVDSAQLLLKMESYWNSYLDTNPPGIRFGRSPSGTPVPLHDIDDKSRARYTKRIKRVPNGWSLTDVKGIREHALILVPDAPRTILRLWTENNSEGGKGLSRRTWVEEVSKTYRGVSRDDIRFLLQIITTLDGPWSALTEAADLTQRLESPDRDNDDYEFGVDAETERVELELEEIRPIGPPRKKRKQSTRSSMATNATDATENASANPNATTVNTTTTNTEAMATTMNITEANTATKLPRVTIQFCTQCKWMLRAAYVSLTFRTQST